MSAGDQYIHDEPLEKIASMLETVGFPHAIARVYAALTLAEGEGLSTTEIIGKLDISRASVSNAMQFLVAADLAERYRVRGTREAHYRMLKGRWAEILARKFAGTAALTRSMEEALAASPSAKARERLEEMHDVFAFFERELEDVMQRFNERKKS